MTTVVLGGGYAGVMAANRLASHGLPAQLVTPDSWFVERIRLHEVAGGAREDARIPFERLLDPAVELILDTAVKVDDETVQLASGAELGFTHVIYTVGSGAPRSGVHRIASEGEAARLHAALQAQPDASVTVVGAGLTGVELTGALLDAGRRVRLATASVPRRRAARAHLAALARRGATVETGVRVDLTGDDGGGLVVDTTGFDVPRLAADSGLPTDPHGRLVVDDTLTVPGHPRILGAGDAALVIGPRGEHLRHACATALPQGAGAADVVCARTRGVRPEPLSLGYLLQCVDLGGGSGHVQLVHADDSERPFAITGRAGGMVKEAVCRMTVRWLTTASRYSWPSAPHDVRQGVTERHAGPVTAAE